MLRHDDRAPGRLDFRQYFMKADDGFFIQVGRGLIQNIDFGVCSIHRTTGDLLFLTAGELKDIPSHECVKLHIAAGFVDPSMYLLPGHSLILTSEGKLSGRIHIKKLTFGILKYASDITAGNRQLFLTHIDVIYINGTFHFAWIEMRGKPIDHSCQSGLTASASSAEDNNLSIINAEVDIIYPFSGPGFSAIMEACIVKSNHFSLQSFWPSSG